MGSALRDDWSLSIFFVGRVSIMLFSITTARGAVASLSITRLRRRSRPPPHKYLIYVLHLPKQETYEIRLSPLVRALQQLQDQQVPAARVGRPLGTL